MSTKQTKQTASTLKQLKEVSGLFTCLLEHQVIKTTAQTKWDGPKIPPEEWAKVQEAGKSIDMEDMAGVIRRGIDRLEEASKEQPNLPEVYRKVIDKEKADLQTRADNLEKP